MFWVMMKWNVIRDRVMDHIWRWVFRTRFWRQQRKMKEQDVDSEDNFGLLVLAETFVRMIPPFLYICAFFLCTFLYTYAIIGIELFAEERTVCDRARFIQGIPRFINATLLLSLFLLEYNQCFFTSWSNCYYTFFYFHLS